MEKCRSFVVAGCLGVAFLVSGCSRSMVIVDSAPRGAGVFLNDSAVGTTPWKGLVDNGPVRLTMELEEYPVLDTNFRVHPGMGRMVYYPAIGFGSIGLFLYAVSDSNLALETVAMAAGYGLLFFGEALRKDHEIHYRLAYAHGAVAEKKIVYAVNERFSVEHSRTLEHADSICWESARRTVWMKRAGTEAQHPYAVSALQRCEVGSSDSWRSPSILSAMGWGALIGGGIGGVAGLAGDGDHVNKNFVAGAMLGGLGGFFWGALRKMGSPPHQECDAYQNALDFLDWLEQRPCQTPGSGAPPASAAEPEAEPPVLPPELPSSPADSSSGFRVVPSL